MSAFTPGLPVAGQSLSQGNRAISTKRFRKGYATKLNTRVQPSMNANYDWDKGVQGLNNEKYPFMALIRHTQKIWNQHLVSMVKTDEDAQIVKEIQEDYTRAAKYMKHIFRLWSRSSQRIVLTLRGEYMEWQDVCTSTLNQNYDTIEAQRQSLKHMLDRGAIVKGMFQFEIERLTLDTRDTHELYTEYKEKLQALINKRLQFKSILSEQVRATIVSVEMDAPAVENAVNTSDSQNRQVREFIYYSIDQVQKMIQNIENEIKHQRKTFDKLFKLD